VAQLISDGLCTNAQSKGGCEGEALDKGNFNATKELLEKINGIQPVECVDFDGAVC